MWTSQVQAKMFGRGWTDEFSWPGLKLTGQA
jgi:hypothetical protein